MTPLTVREHEVLRLLADGLQLKQVAATLGISAHTVATHLRFAKAKLAAFTIGQAVSRGYEEGLLP